MSRVLVEAYGCSANVADSEIASGLLREAGFTLVDGFDESDAVVVLTCAVKTPTERKILKRLRWIASRGRPLVVAGCMPKVLAGPVEAAAPGASMLGPDDLGRVAEAAGEALAGRRIVEVDGSSPDRCLVPRVRRSGVVHIAPIASGCLGSCAYCIVKNARGRLRSFPADGIVEDARRALAEGCREIWVTAEDTACYESAGDRLPDLLGKLSALPGRFRVRVGMMTPSHAAPILGDLLEAFRDPKVFKFLHVPVQSGSDGVLRRMRRRYTVDEFRGVVSRFREGFPESCVSTDLICGFPGESEEEFRETVSLLEWLRPDALNISRFWPRPGTEAAGLDGQLPGGVVKARSKRLTELWRRLNLETTERWLGWEGEILLDEEGHAGTVEGRNDAYKAMTVSGGLPLGGFVRVRAVKADMGFLRAELA